MLKIGLTGGIGSGKSVVSELFRCLQVPVYEADRRARLLMHEEAGLRDELVSLFGQQIYTEQGLDRKHLARIVFSDREALQKLNMAVHPYVLRDFAIWLRKQGHAPYVVHEAAILFESGADPLFDHIITIEAPDALRIQRVVERDGVTPRSVKDRMDNQLSSAERIRRADFVLINDEDHMLIPQVLELHALFLARSALKTRNGI